MKVAILDDIHDAWAGCEAMTRLRRIAEVDVFRDAFGSPAALDAYDVLIANRERTKFDRELLGSLKARLIIQTGNHAAHLDFAAAAEFGITVGQASGGYSVGAAELAIGLAIAAMRRIPSLDRQVRAGAWTVPSTPVMQGKTFGVVGLGRVGSHAGRIAGAFGMRVLGWSPSLDQARAAERGAEFRELDDLLRESDIVSIHASLTQASRGLIDARRLALMRPGAWLINTARGPIVDEAALIAALQEKRIAGAGLDVFDREPLPAGHPLTALENVVLTPHIGWPTDAGYARFADSAAEVLEAWQAGEPFPVFGAH